MEVNSVLRDGTVDLTADETLTTFKVGPMNKPLWLHVMLPTASGAGDTLDVTLEFCAKAANTTAISILSMKQMTNAAGYYSIPFYTKHEYVQVKLNVTDAGGGVNYGKAKVWIAPAARAAGQYNK